MSKGLSNDQRQRLMSDMQDEIHQLKSITQNINRTLDGQKQTRDSLGDYLDKGTQALKQINGVLSDMGGRYSIFGCNGVIVLGVALLTILVLIIL